MLNTKKELKRYLEMDKRALNIKRKRPRILGDDIWKFQIILRKHEYYHNTNKKFMSKIYSYLHYKYGLKLGFSIPCNVFGPGLRIYCCKSKGKGWGIL